ncbi:MAG TPA: hypothetical protein VJT31_14100 [Rugosimonospora sp.]|nr:hypothetical protein [Rugosimonospora sp.]
MYLVVVTVDTPGWNASVDILHKELSTSASGSDGLQHAYLEAGDERLAISLYLQAPDEQHAATLADQLCRRVLASVSPAGRWSVQSVHIGP